VNTSLLLDQAELSAGEHRFPASGCCQPCPGGGGQRARAAGGGVTPTLPLAAGRQAACCSPLA